MCDVRISRFVHIIYPYEYVICIHPLSSSSSFDYVNRVSCACHLYTSSIIIIIIWLRKSRELCLIIIAISSLFDSRKTCELRIIIIIIII